MQKVIIIALAILFVVMLTNRVNTAQTFDDNLNSIIGCLDYTYAYSLNVPATLTFYVSENNKEDLDGFFKVITAEDTEGSTILHCGNEYFLIASAPGYSDYTEKIPATPFRPITPEVNKIILEKS